MMRLRVLTFLGLVLVASFSYGEPVFVSVGLAVEDTDNALRAATNPQNETTVRPSVIVRQDAASPVFTSQLEFTATQDNYLNDTSNDRSGTEGEGTITARAIPERLEFLVNHTRQRALENQQLADIPANESDRLSTTILAHLNFVLPAGTRFVYSPAWHQLAVSGPNTSEIDATFQQFRFERNTSAQWQSHLSFEETRAKRVDAVDYTTRQIVAGIDWESQRLQVNLEGGPQKITDDDGFSSRSTASELRITYTTSLGQIQWSSQRQLTDATSGIIGTPGEQQVAAGVDQTGTDLQRIARTNLAWNVAPGERLNISASGSRDKRLILESGLQDESQAITAAIRYRARRHLTLGVISSVVESTQANQPPTDRTSSTFRVDSTVSGKLSFNLSIRREKQMTDTQITSTNSIEMGLEYCLSYCGR